MNCIPLAVGSVSDHAHVLVWMSPEVGVAQLARELKAPTTRFIHRELKLPEFAWQEGYGAFTLRESEIEAVRRYVDNQPQHHTDGSVVAEWERAEPPSVKEAQSRSFRKPPLWGRLLSHVMCINARARLAVPGCSREFREFLPV